MIDDNGLVVDVVVVGYTIQRRYYQQHRSGFLPDDTLCSIFRLILPAADADADVDDKPDVRQVVMTAPFHNASSSLFLVGPL